MKEANFKRNTWANLAQALPGPVHFTTKEEREMNRASLAVIPHDDSFDESNSPFFAPATGGASSLLEPELAALDALIEHHGLANVLKAVQSLLESRIEEGMMTSGRVLLHLSRDDAYARAAERLRDLAFHPDIAEL